MKRHKNSKKYAKMFLNTVGADNAAKALEELALVEAMFRESEDFHSLLVNPSFGHEERGNAVSAIGKRLSLSETTVKFVGFLSLERAAWALSDVLMKAIAVYLERQARAKATVITPSPIDVSYEARIKESLKRITNKDVDVEYDIDPSLLGGILIKVGSTMFDGSVRGQLRLLSEELIKG